MCFIAGDGDHEVTVDYPLPSDEEGPQGLTSLKLLLASLATCSGNTLALLLRKRDQRFSGVEVRARGLRRDEHPTVITEIDLDFTVRGENIDEALVERCLVVAEQQLCPVWAMLKDSTPIRTTVTLVND